MSLKTVTVIFAHAVTKHGHAQSYNCSGESNLRAAVEDFSVNNDFLLFSLFLTQSYRMTSEDYVYSAQVIKSTLMVTDMVTINCSSIEQYEDSSKKSPCVSQKK